MTTFDGSELDDMADGAPGFVGFDIERPGPYVLQVVALGSAPLHSSEFVGWYDVDARDGRGVVHLVHHVDQALQFPNAGAALAAWRTRSTVRPTRDDGKPNRPLTAYTVEVLTVDQARPETTRLAADRTTGTDPGTAETSP